MSKVWRVRVFWGVVYALAAAVNMVCEKIKDYAAEQIWPEPDEDES